MIDYKIALYISTDDEKLKPLFGEMNSFSIEDISDYEISFQKIFSGQSDKENVYLTVSNLEIKKNITKVFWANELIIEVKTIDIYEVFIKFKLAIQAWSIR